MLVARGNPWELLSQPHVSLTCKCQHNHRFHGVILCCQSKKSWKVDMKEVMQSLQQTTTPEQLHVVMSPYVKGQGQSRPSLRFMVSLLSRDPDWRRSLALLDWMVEVADYPPSIFAYNVVLRNTLRDQQWEVATGLVHEMFDRYAISPDRCTYATLISAFGKAGHLDSALQWLHRMESHSVSADLVLYSSLIELARKLGDHSKAISLFSRLRRSGITPDLVACNSMINVFGKAGLLREARQLLDELGDGADIVSYSTLLTALVDNKRYVEALSLFATMKERQVALDLTTCNITIDVYGQLGMAKEADRLFWAMGKMGIHPSVITYNTLLKVYGEGQLFGEAIHLFRLMQKKGVQQNVVTYNTMINIYGKSLEHQKAANLVQEMQAVGIQPNVVTYSTIISIWAKVGKLDRAATLFQKIRSSGGPIDPVLYQTMILAYERAGLVAHAKRLLQDLKHPNEDEEFRVSKDMSIYILASAGRVEEATQLFRRAIEANEVKEIGVFRVMIELFARNRKHRNVVEVFEKMRVVGYFPNTEMIGLVLNSYGKLQELGKAKALYLEMQEEGCVFSDEVHFQMLSLLGERRDFKNMETLLDKLNSDPNIDKKGLHLVVASIYEKSNMLDKASNVISKMQDVVSKF